MKTGNHFSPGQAVLLRELWQGRIWTARPEIVVQDTPKLAAFYMAAGTRWRQSRTKDNKHITAHNRSDGDWVLYDVEWYTTGRLRMTVPGYDYSVLIFRKPDGSLDHWYINLEEEFHRTERGFDYIDQILDIVASPDLSKWHWKDEDELEEVVNLGALSEQRASELRSVGEEAIAWLQSGNSPFNGWKDWQPDPSWSVPALPENWNLV